MNVLLSTIGSRGDVQPLLALAMELRGLGHAPTLAAPPNFRDFVEARGVAFVPVGPDVRNHPATSGQRPAPPTDEQLQALAEGTVRAQFAALSDVARGQDAIVGATVLQLAAPSLAEAYRIPYVFATFCPVCLPSTAHAPPVMMGPPHAHTLPADDNRRLWEAERGTWGKRFTGTLNEERAKRGLPPVASVLSYVLTDRPWLAADPVLAPAPADAEVVQTGAWLLADDAALPADLEAFLAAGDPPVLFGFGSMRMFSAGTGEALIAAAHALGKRAIVSRGWGGLAPGDRGDGWIAIDDVSYERLLPRVAAVVHHGGAGTTIACARAGRPQVLVPHNYDQPWWAHRVEELGIGVRLAGAPTVETIRDALVRLDASVVDRARTLAPAIVTQGARASAERLVALA